MNNLARRACARTARLPAGNPPSQRRATSVRNTFLITLLVAWTHHSWGATYYVATTGNDSSGGTFVESPLRTIQAAVNRAVAGDTIVVRGGKIESITDRT